MFEYFNNKSIRRSVIAFGVLFDEIDIKRTNSNETIRVPLSYGPKEKFIRRLQENSSIDGETRTSITLPYMGFEITGLNYDAERARNRTHRRFAPNTSDASTVKSTYAEIPYNVNFDLHIMVRNIEDGLEIIEQIVPYFNPHFTIPMNFNDVAQKVDVPLVLNSVDFNEDYEGDYDTLRSLIYTLSFTMKSYLYGPIKDTKIIKKVQTRLFNLEGLEYGGSSGPSQFNDLGFTGQDGITGATGAFSRVDVVVPDDAVYGSTYATQTDVYVRGNTLAAGLSAGGGCGEGLVGPWFIDIFGATGGYTG